MWIDTHCHLDAPEFGPDQALARDARALAKTRGVGLCVIPAVTPDHFETVRQCAHAWGDVYALGVHPLFVPRAQAQVMAACQRVDQALKDHIRDPRLVAVGEIGLDFFVPELTQSPVREWQIALCREQFRLAYCYRLPVILHVRRSVDVLLGLLRESARQGRPLAGGIAHAFNGSRQQAQAFLDLGFKLGFGGAVTFDAARRLRELAATLPAEAIVMETDAPDIPPQWLYVNAAQRAAGTSQSLNTPAELPRIGAEIAALRGDSVEGWAAATTANAVAALPRLAPWVTAGDAHG